MTRRWHTVRVFISSTFRDFHSERDIITNQVFTELRAWCEQRFIHLVEIDLRWGVTSEESATGKALEVCLDELDRSDFFVCLVGSRYGWIPESYQVGPGRRFDWVRQDKQGRSVTEMEICRAVLNAQGARALNISHAMFYVRDESFMNQVPLEYMSDFCDGTFSRKGGTASFERDQNKAEKIQSLRNSVVEAGREAKRSPDPSLSVKVRENYSCYFAGTTRVAGVHADKPILQGLEPFTQQLIIDLKTAIEERYPIRKMLAESMTSELVQHRESTNNFMEHRTRNFQGRESAVRGISEYVHAKNVYGLFLLSGEDGTGKTAVISKAFRQLTAEYKRKTRSQETETVDHEPMILVPFIAGAGPGSLQPQNMLRAIIQDIRNQLRTIKPREKVDARWSALKTTVKMSQVPGLTSSSLSGFLKSSQESSSDVQESATSDSDEENENDEDEFNYTRSKSIRGRAGPQEFSGSFEKLVEFFKRTLERACKHAKVVLFIDNISHMKRDENNVTSLHWIPTILPENLRLVLTVDDDDSPDWVQEYIRDVLQSQRDEESKSMQGDQVSTSEGDTESKVEPQTEKVDQRTSFLSTRSADMNNSRGTSKKSPPLHSHVRIGGLDRSCAEKLIVSHLHNYSKKLDSGQLDLLTAKAVDKSPTWLVLACEELRVFSIFEKVVDRIRNIPEDVPSLLDQLISRLELEHSPQFVQDALTLFIFARDGLFEHEIMSILGVAQRAWSLLFYNLKPFLHNNDSVGNDEVIRFSHREWKKAIETRYKLHRPARAARIHRRLASYFLKQSYCKDSSEGGAFSWNSEKARELWCLPFHLMNGGCFVELERVLTDLRFVEAKCAAGMNYEWVDDIVAAISEVNNFIVKTAARRRSSVASTFLQNQSGVLQATQFPSPGGEMVSGGVPITPAPLSCFQLEGDPDDDPDMPPFTIEQAQEMELRLHDFSRFAQSYAPELGLHPHLLFQYAANYPDCTVVARAALLQYQDYIESFRRRTIQQEKTCGKAHRRGEKTLSWLQWINKPQETDPCLLTLKGHSGPVTCCAISHDDTFVASGSADSTVKVWMVQTGELSQTLQGHDGKSITCIAFHPDDPFTIVSGGWDGKVRTWNNGSQSFVFDGHKGGVVCCVAVSNDAQFVISGDDHGRVLVWDSMTGEVLRDLKGFPSSSSVRKCCFSEDGYKAMATDSSKTIRGWELSTGEQFLCKTGEGIGIFQANSYSPDCLQFIVRTSAMKLRLFESNSTNSEQGAEYERTQQESISQVLRSTGALSEQPSYFGQSSANFKTLAPAFISPKSYRSLNSARPRSTRIHSSQPEQTPSILENGEGPQEDLLRNTVRFSRDVHLTSCIFEPEARFVNTCAISRDDRVSLACVDGTIRVFHGRTGRKLCMLYGHSGSVLDVCYSGRGDRVVSASADGTVRIWNPKRARMIKHVPHSTEIVKCSFQPGFAHKVVSLSAEGEVSLWDTRTGKRRVISDKLVADPKSKHRAPGVSVIDVEFTPSGKYLVSKSTTLRIWELKTGDAQVELLAAKLANSRSTGSKGAALPAPQHVAGSNLDILGNFKQLPIVNVGEWAVSPCERLVVVVEKNKSAISCWDIRSSPCTQTCELDGHTKAVSSLKFSFDGRFIFSSAHDGTVNVWDAIRAANNRGIGIRESNAGTEEEQNSSHRPRSFLVVSLRDASAIGRSSIIHSSQESPSGNRLLTVSDGSEVKLWNLKDALCGEKLTSCSASLLAPGDNSKVTVAVFSPNGRTVASGSMGGRLRVWDCELRQLQLDVRAHIAPITALEYFSDGAKIMTASEDFSLHIWDSASGACLNTMVFSASISFAKVSYCGRFMIAGDSCGDLRILKMVNPTTIGSTGVLATQNTTNMPIVTPTRRVLLTLRGSNKWDNKCRAQCVYCSILFLVKGHTMEAIRQKAQSVILYGENDDGFDSPNFIVRCDTCKGFLRCNPFLLDRQQLKRFRTVMEQGDGIPQRVILSMREVEPSSPTQNMEPPGSLATAERALLRDTNPDTQSHTENQREMSNNQSTQSENEDENGDEQQPHYDLGIMTSKELKQKAASSYYDSPNIINPFRMRDTGMGKVKLLNNSASGPLPRRVDINKSRGRYRRVQTSKSHRRRRSSTPMLEVRAPTSRAVQLLTPLATPVIQSFQRPQTTLGMGHSTRAGTADLVRSTSKQKSGKMFRRKPQSIGDDLSSKEWLRAQSASSLKPRGGTARVPPRANTSGNVCGDQGIVAPHALQHHWLDSIHLSGEENELRDLLESPGNFGCVKDRRYLSVEGPHFRVTNTCSTVSAQVQRGVQNEELHMQPSTSDFRIPKNMFNIYHGEELEDTATKVDRKHGNQIRISPVVLSLGSICEKSVYRVPLKILNLGSNGVKYRAAVEMFSSEEFERENKSGRNPLQASIVYPRKGHSVIPGIASILHVELKVLNYVRELRGRVVISTDFGEVFSIPLGAKVLTETDFDSCSQSIGITKGRGITNPRCVLMKRIRTPQLRNEKVAEEKETCV